MLNIDEVVGKTFASSRQGDGYDAVDVDAFRFEVEDALRWRDRLIAELQKELSEARAAIGDADAGQAGGTAAAARLLEVAATTADQLTSEARAEAEAAVAEARAEAHAVVTEARAEAEALTEAAFERTEAAAAQLDWLREVEGRHRDQLRRHFTEQLALLEDDAPALSVVNPA
jgi:cell division septum initiation protein DivIVA